MSTIRVYINNERVATGRPMKDGRFYQVFPYKEYFATEAVWREAVSKEYAISFVSDEPAPVTPVKKPTATAIPVAPPAPKKPQQQQQEPRYNYFNFTNMTLPAGRYYIGDLCYALKKSVYDSVFGDNAYRGGYYNTKDGFFFVDRTAYGDGSFKGSNGYEYGVDAGIIGIASMGVCNPEKEVYGGTLHTFTEPVECNFRNRHNENGFFEFTSGSFHLIINTAYD